MTTAAARLTRASHTSFYYAFRILPPAKRQAIFALYSFCRAVDDCVDEEGGGGAEGLDRWSAELERCYAARAESELGRELAAAVAAFPISRSCLEDVIEGCRMDLTTRRYATWPELEVYCRRVASAVGLATIEIFGYRSPATRDYAVALGLALQLTNILRDVAADAAKDRIYIPFEDLARFGLSDEGLLAAARLERAGPALRPLLQHQAARAREQFARARSLLPAEDRRAMASAEIMGAVYHALLEELERRGFPLAAPRVTLSRRRKAWVALRSLAGTYWAP